MYSNNSVYQKTQGFATEMTNTTFGRHTESGQCCLFDRLWGMYEQQWDKQPKDRICRVYCSRHTMESSAGSLSYAIYCSSLEPALVQPSCLFLAYVPAALVEASAFEQRSCGCPLSLSTSGCPGWIDLERPWSAPGNVQLVLFTATDCSSV